MALILGSKGEAKKSTSIIEKMRKDGIPVGMVPGGMEDAEVIGEEGVMKKKQKKKKKAMRRKPDKPASGSFSSF